MAPIVSLESSSNSAQDLTNDLLLIAIAAGMLVLLCALLFSVYKFGGFCVRTLYSICQPPLPMALKQQPLSSTTMTGSKPLTILSWATLIDETVGAHPHALPLDQRICPPGYLNYIHLPVAFPSLPPTTRVGLIVTQYFPGPAPSESNTSRSSFSRDRSWV